MRAPEFPQNLRWLNSPPLQMKELRGRVVLIDFWTYSCVNCIKTLSYVKEWHERYSKAGLTIVGVHTPEFEFEKNVENVVRAIKEFGITYPVVMDNDYQAWSLYSNNAWPHKFLMNKDGQIVYEHAGEGAYKETEEAVQKSLLEIDAELKLPSIAPAAGAGGVCLPTIPEIHLGMMSGKQGKIWNFAGEWKMHPEFIEHTRESENFLDYLVLNFDAADVNLVMGASGERSAKIRLELDGKFLKELEVREPKMYNLITGSEQKRGELKIFVKDQEFRAYAFTFGGCT